MLILNSAGWHLRRGASGIIILEQATSDYDSQGRRLKRLALCSAASDEEAWCWLWWGSPTMGQGELK